jgi:predicted nucleic acid-binding Zn ribbon protein
MSGKARSSKFKSLKDVASELLDSRLGSKLADYEAVKAWPDACGPKIASRCVAMGIKSGILYVTVPTSVWLTELKALKNKLITNVNAKVGREVVKDIKFLAGNSKRKI